MLQDLRYAWRLFAKSPGFTVVVILTLALGIGANTAVFSLVNGALLRPLPYKDPGRLIDVLDASKTQSGFSKLFDSYRDYQEYSAHARTIEQISLGSWAVGSTILTGRGPARSILAVPVSETFFTMLGVDAARGRTFHRDDLQHGCSVVLSDGFWRDTLGAQGDIVGASLTLNKRSCTVMGVMPPSFAFYPKATKLWTLVTPDFDPPPDKFPVLVFARLKPGYRLEQAQQELTALHAAAHPNDLPERDFRPEVNSVQADFTWLAGRNLTTTLWVLLGAVGLVLLIVCVNVANLLLGRSFSRAREFAIRAALGSGQARLMRQLLAEGLLLAVVGGALGVLVAFGALRYFKLVNPVELPVGADISLSLPVLGFTAALSIFTALLFGLLPAWKGSRSDLNEGLRAGGRGMVSSSHRLAKTLAGAEMALSLMLLAGAGLLMQSVFNFSSAPLGFDPNHVITGATTLPKDRYAEAAQQVRFYDEFHRRLKALPGVESAALSSSMPPYGVGFNIMQVQGRSQSVATLPHDTGLKSISEDYFGLMRIPLRKGRLFNERDRPESEQVAIVNDALAREYFPDSDPIGQRVRVGEGPDIPWLTIVGVVGTEKGTTVFKEMAWVDSVIVYRPLRQNPTPRIVIGVRTLGNQSGIGREVQHTISALDSNVPANELDTLQHALNSVLTYPRFRAIVLGAFAGLALLLAAIGLQGVLAQFVTQRTQEIGVRMAIGAQASDILRLVVRQGGVPVIAGLLIGLAGTIALTRYLTSLLYGVQPGDPLTLVWVSLALLASAALAIAIPARRAAQVDPMIALREE